MPFSDRFGDENRHKRHQNMAVIQGAANRSNNAPPMGRVVMLQGTGSSVGKSLVVTGFCRVFAQDGYRVAPFKAQNMSRNSGVTPDGLEIGRAQVAQAQAAGIEPVVEMNPVLIKPEGNATSQLVSMGKMVGKLRAYEFMTRREVLWQTIKDSLDTLRSRFDVRSRFDIVVIEGAGSPAEINLRAPDIVNMEVALYGTFAQLDVGAVARPNRPRVPVCPTPWIPAYAGMTVVVAGMTVVVQSTL